MLCSSNFAWLAFHRPLPCDLDGCLVSLHHWKLTFFFFNYFAPASRAIEGYPLLGYKGWSLQLVHLLEHLANSSWRRTVWFSFPLRLFLLSVYSTLVRTSIPKFLAFTLIYLKTYLLDKTKQLAFFSLIKINKTWNWLLLSLFCMIMPLHVCFRWTFLIGVSLWNLDCFVTFDTCVLAWPVICHVSPTHDHLNFPCLTICNHLPSKKPWFLSLKSSLKSTLGQ